MLGCGFMATLISQSGGQGNAAGAGLLAGIGAALGVVFLIFGVLYVLVGWGMLKLKAWARIVTMVLMGLAILGSLFGLTTIFVHFSVFPTFCLAVPFPITRK